MNSHLTGQSCGPAFDEGGFGKLQSLDPEGRTGLVKRILSVYESTLGPAQANAEMALAARDWPALKFAVHSLKGSSASVGAMRLAALSAEIEQAAIQQDVDATRALMWQWTSELAAVRAQLPHLLER